MDRKAQIKMDSQENSTENPNTEPVSKDNKFSPPRLNKLWNSRNRNFPIGKLIAGIVIVIIIVGIYSMVSSIRAAMTGGGSSNSSQIADVLSSQPINKDFSFGINDSSGKEVTKFKLQVQNAELRNQIIVKGEKASAVEGRVFLVINLKITNDYSKNIQLNTRDYFRLTVNNNDKELLAPEIHNDPVEVQATSTKYTRIGFAINKTDKNIKLRVGEIDKDKTIIDLNKL